MTEERRSHLSTFVEWDKRLGIRRTVVLFVTLWMSYKAFDGALHFAFAHVYTNGLEAAAIIAAVTAPVTYLQKVVFQAYIEAGK